MTSLETHLENKSRASTVEAPLSRFDVRDDERYSRRPGERGLELRICPGCDDLVLCRLTTISSISGLWGVAHCGIYVSTHEVSGRRGIGA